MADHAGIAGGPGNAVSLIQLTVGDGVGQSKIGRNRIGQSVSATDILKGDLLQDANLIVDLTEGKVGNRDIIVVSHAVGRKQGAHVHNQAGVGYGCIPVAGAVESVQVHTVHKQLQGVFLSPFHGDGELVAHFLIQDLGMNYTADIQDEQQSIYGVDNTVVERQRIVICTEDLTCAAGEARHTSSTTVTGVSRTVRGQDGQCVSLEVELDTGIIGTVCEILNVLLGIHEGNVATDHRRIGTTVQIVQTVTVDQLLNTMVGIVAGYSRTYRLMFAVSGNEPADAGQGQHFTVAHIRTGLNGHGHIHTVVIDITGQAQNTQRNPKLNNIAIGCNQGAAADIHAAAVQLAILNGVVTAVELEGQRVEVSYVLNCNVQVRLRPLEAILSIQLLILIQHTAAHSPALLLQNTVDDDGILAEGSVYILSRLKLFQGHRIDLNGNRPKLLAIDHNGQGNGSGILQRTGDLTFVGNNGGIAGSPNQVKALAVDGDELLGQIQVILNMVQIQFAKDLVLGQSIQRLGSFQFSVVGNGQIGNNHIYMAFICTESHALDVVSGAGAEVVVACNFLGIQCLSYQHTVDIVLGRYFIIGVVEILNTQVIFASSVILHRLVDEVINGVIPVDQLHLTLLTHQTHHEGFAAVTGIAHGHVIIADGKAETAQGEVTADSVSRTVVGHGVDLHIRFKDGGSTVCGIQVVGIPDHTHALTVLSGVQGVK